MSKDRWQTNIDRGMCGRCGNNFPAPGNKKCQQCMEYASQAAAKRRTRLEEMGLCTACGKRNPAQNRDLCIECLEYHKGRINHLEEQKRSRQKLKDSVFGAYGGYVCACCGVSEQDMLVIDHIDSNAHWRLNRKLEGSEGSMGFYRWLRKEGFPEGFQVLCANCNQSKRMNGGVECSHKLTTS